MPSIEVDSQVETAELTQNGDGFEFKRVLIITSLQGKTAQDKLNSVLKTPGIPVYGGRLPGAVNVYAYDFKVKFAPGCSNKALLEITYTPYQQSLNVPSENAKPDIYCGSALVTKKTNIDINGETMTVSYQRTTEANGQAVGSIDVQTGSVEIQIPQPFLQFSRKEPKEPSRKSEFFTGKINASQWYGDPAKLWLCTKLEGKRRPDGAYDVTYEFQKSNFGWAASVVYVDPATGKTPADVLEGTGIKTFDVYETADFNALNLGV